MVIYFMRHTAVDVPQGVCYGQTDVPLKPTFEMEATQTAAHLQGLSFDKVYTSPLTRCVRLATFCGYPDAERDDRLKELNLPSVTQEYWNLISEIGKCIGSMKLPTLTWKDGMQIICM